MSRRRQPRKPFSSRPAPNDGTPLGHLSDVELMRAFAAEMARRGAAQGEVDLDSIERFSEESQRDLGQETLDAAIAALAPEDDSAKPCPKCKQRVPVKAKNRARHILTTAGELRLTRSYHHCIALGAFSAREIAARLGASLRTNQAQPRSRTPRLKPGHCVARMGAEAPRRRSRES